MFSLTKHFTSEKFSITPIQMEGKVLIFLPWELEEQLGYEDLSHSILTSAGMVEGVDHLVLRDSNLKALKELMRSIGSTDLPPQVYDKIKFMPTLLVPTESGLYNLMFRSKKESCQAFRIWVTSEVLPEIRKTGRYEGKKATGDKLTDLAIGIGISKTAYLEQEFNALQRLANTFGLMGNQGILSAANAIRKEYEVDLLQLTGVSLKSESQERIYTPTELGKVLKLSGKAVNLLLQARTLHEKDAKRDWKMTKAGEKYGVYLDVGKRHSDGTPIMQLKWKESVMELLK